MVLTPACVKPGDVEPDHSRGAQGQIDEATIRRAWGDPSSPQVLVGLTSSELVRALGEPKTTAELELTTSSRLLEYQSSLFKVIPAAGSIEIREWTWSKGDKTIKVWLRGAGDQWASFDSLVWSDNVRF